MSCPLSLRLDGPLTRYREAFWSYLSVQGYKPTSAREQVRLFAHLSRRLADAGRTPESIDHALLENFAATRRQEGRRGWISSRALNAIRGFLADEGVVAVAALVPPRDKEHHELLDRYCAWLEGERSLASPQVHRHTDLARQFLLESLGRGGSDDLHTLAPVHVLAFVHARRIRYQPGTVCEHLSRLRSFLHFLFLHGLSEQDLRGAAPSPRRVRQKILPATLEADEVVLLLRSCDRRGHRGRRDLAILLLMLKLGLRRSDVAALALEDIDWARGELRVSGKSRREDRLPLPDEIGTAIVDYLRRSRPTSEERALFFTLSAPVRPIRPTTVTRLISEACRRAGLPPERAPRLRHTAASLMLGAGSSLDEIAQVLRHRSIETTAVYAKIDDRALLELVGEWPEALS